MNTKNPWKKYLGIGIVALAVVILSIIFYFCLFYPQRLNGAIKEIVSIMMPILYGGVLAYLLAPVCNYLDNLQVRIQKRLFPKKKEVRYKYRCIISISISILLLILLIFWLCRLVLPQVMESLFNLVDMLPGTIKQVTDWAQNQISSNPEMSELLVDMYTSAVDWLQNIIKNVIQPNIQSIITGLTSSIVQVFVVVKDLVVGLIVAIYLMAGRKRLSAETKKLAFALSKKETAERIISRGKFTHRVFNGFVTGKLLDSLIIGIAAFICLHLMQMPYAVLISVIISITNIIPFFGPFIGAIPSALLILLVDPLKCLYFVIFIIILQQIDGNIIGPRILGDSTGLAGFWVIFAILLFGGLFGFVGMVVGVPLFAVIYDMIRCTIQKRLEKNSMPQDYQSYM